MFNGSFKIIFVWKSPLLRTMAQHATELYYFNSEASIKEQTCSSTFTYLSEYTLVQFYKEGICLSLFPSFSFPDVLCRHTDLIWRYGTPSQAIISRTAFTRRFPSWRFPRFSSVVRKISGDLYTTTGYTSLSPLSFADWRDILDK